MGLKIYALLCSNISNLYCFEYIPESGKTICALLFQYVKCLLLRIYPRVGVNNMHTFIQQYFKCLLFRIYPRVGENHICILYPYVKSLLFRIYSRVGVNNMYTFIQQYFKCLLFRIYPRVGKNHMCTFVKCLLFRMYPICQMFTISHIFPYRGKQYVHFYSNILYVCCFTHVPVSGK